MAQSCNPTCPGYIAPRISENIPDLQNPFTTHTLPHNHPLKVPTYQKSKNKLKKHKRDNLLMIALCLLALTILFNLN